MIDNQSLFSVVRYGAMLGMVVCATLAISLNYSVFKRIFRERTASMWWLFLTISVIPFVVMLGVFTILFQRVTLIQKVFQIQDGKVVADVSQQELIENNNKSDDASEVLQLLIKEWKKK